MELVSLTVSPEQRFVLLLAVTVGTVGAAITKTSIRLLSGLLQVPKRALTLYLPAVFTIIELVVAPLLQIYLSPPVAVRVTESPLHKLTLPLAVIVGGVILEVAIQNEFETSLLIVAPGKGPKPRAKFTEPVKWQ